MESVKEIVQRVMDSVGSGEEYRKFRLEQFWRDVMSEEIVEKTSSLDWREDILCIVVKTADLKTTLESLKSEILHRLRREFPDIPLLCVKIFFPSTSP